MSEKAAFLQIFLLISTSTFHTTLGNSAFLSGLRFSSFRCPSRAHTLDRLKDRLHPSPPFKTISGACHLRYHWLLTLAIGLIARYVQQRRWPYFSRSSRIWQSFWRASLLTRRCNRRAASIAEDFTAFLPAEDTGVSVPMAAFVSQTGCTVIKRQRWALPTPARLSGTGTHRRWHIDDHPQYHPIRYSLRHIDNENNRFIIYPSSPIHKMSSMFCAFTVVLIRKISLYIISSPAMYYICINHLSSLYFIRTSL